jgi:hypothetical protein
LAAGGVAKVKPEAAMNQPNAIQNVVQSYTERGQFRHLLEQRDGTVFEFKWLNNQAMKLTWDPGSKTLLFRDILPNIPARSELHKELKKFLMERFDPERPEHRRLDAQRVALVCTNRKSSLSVGLKLASPDDEYGPRKLVNLVHEMFVYLTEAWPDYMYESFRHPLE